MSCQGFVVNVSHFEVNFPELPGESGVFWQAKTIKINSLLELFDCKSLLKSWVFSERSLDIRNPKHPTHSVSLYTYNLPPKLPKCSYGLFGKTMKNHQWPLELQCRIFWWFGIGSTKM